MPKRTTPGEDSFFSRLMDRWQREQRTMSKSPAAGLSEAGFELWGWTETVGELILSRRGEVDKAEFVAVIDATRLVKRQ